MYVRCETRAYFSTTFTMVHIRAYNKVYFLCFMLQHIIELRVVNFSSYILQLSSKSRRRNYYVCRKKLK